MGVLTRQHAYATQALLHGVVVDKDVRDVPDIALHQIELGEHALEALGIDVPPHAANLAGAEDDAAAGGGFDDVEHAFAHAPGGHEQALEAHRIRHKPHPEQVAVQ